MRKRRKSRSEKEMEIVWRAWWWSSVEIEAWFLENEKYVQLLCFVKKQFFFFTKKKTVSF
jgi:hypothetical protein